MHYYTQTGEAMHFVPNKSTGGTRPTTVRDCRILGLVPSPTTILSVLAKPALTDWLVRQGVYAVCTAPDVPGESLDAKITRVLDVEQQQHEESRNARDLGSEIHEAIEQALSGKPFNEELRLHIAPIIDFVMKCGRVVATEKVLIGNGHAGKTDCIAENPEEIIVFDFKSAKKLPESRMWPEHALQISSYCGSCGNTGNKRIRGIVVYVSTTEPGQIKAFESENWTLDYERFLLLARFFRLTNGLP